jgi:hypothetical protein
MKTPVLFRTLRKDPNDVFALFPSLPGTNAPWTCTCYQHVGQHSTADYAHCILVSRPSTKTERRELSKELRSIGYAFKIVSKATNAMRQSRWNAIN